jgi:hypothetical protein
VRLLEEVGLKINAFVNPTPVSLSVCLWHTVRSLNHFSDFYKIRHNCFMENCPANVSFVKTSWVKFTPEGCRQIYIRNCVISCEIWVTCRIEDKNSHYWGMWVLLKPVQPETCFPYSILNFSSYFVHFSSDFCKIIWSILCETSESYCTFHENRRSVRHSLRLSRGVIEVPSHILKLLSDFEEFWYKGFLQ